jgi:hypothetical protein
METPTEEKSNELITIAGGVEFEAAYRNNGTKESVKIRQIPISKVHEFLVAMTNEAQMVELYCDKPSGWGDTLTLESASAILDKGQEINLPFFAAWWKRQANWRKIQSQDATTDIEKKIDHLVESRLGNLLPQSPSTTS